MIKAITSLSILALSLSLTACSQKSVQLETVLQANQCGFSQQKVAYISSDKQLRQLFKSTFNSPIKRLDDIDFETSALILVSMGQKPSNGYSITLKSSEGSIENKALSIDIGFNKPAANSYNAQVITSPCVLYKINKQAINSIKLNSTTMH